MTPLKLAKAVAGFASEIKAEEITILDMRKVANFCDFFVIATGTSTRHVRSIAEGIEEKLEEGGLKVRYKQGHKEGRWVLVDLGHIVVHVFDAESREFYGLDYLWQEAKVVKWEVAKKTPADDA